MPLTPLKDFIIFRTDVLFNANVKFRGIGGRELVIDPNKFQPEKNVRIYGEVTGVPLQLSRIPLLQNDRGQPAYVEYHESLPYSNKYINDIVPEVQVGDRIYFHFNTIKQGNFVDIEGVHPNRTWFIKVRYDAVLCLVREGVITPVGSYVLVDPDMETWEEIQIPTYSSMKDKEGNPILKPKEQWIFTKAAPEARFLQGFVRHVGPPLKGDKRELELGQKIWFRKWADWTNHIEGHDYFAIRQRHIIGKEVDGEFVPVNNYVLIEGEAMEEKKTKAGIILKKERVKRGIITHPGSSSYQVGADIHIGDAERQELKIGEKTFFVIKSQDILGVQV